jgi:multidrug efflux system membrane fusion protein
MKRLTRVVVALVGVALIAGIALVLRATSANGAAKGPAAASSVPGERVVPVGTALVVRKDVPKILEGLGTVTPLATVTVKSQVDGRLDRVLFIEGQAVKKGEVIALVDPRPFLIQLHTAEATLAKDESQLKNGQLNLERYEALRKGNLIPQQQVDDQRALVAQLDATTRSDRAAIDSARLSLDYARITSPIDGVTGVRQVDPGNLVHVADANGIVVLTQIDPIAVLFTLPQDDLPRVQLAMKEGKVAVDAYARDGIQKLATGELLLVDNQVNAQTATIRLKSVLPNPDHVLWPNAFVKARMHLSPLRNVLVVPASAIQRGPSGTFAYVVQVADKSVSSRPIEVAQIAGDVAVISKGLTEGETVVTDGQNQLKPGSKVSSRPPGTTADAGSPRQGAP